MEMKTVHIRDLGDIITGSTPTKKNPDNYGDFALWIKPTDMDENNKYTRETEEMFSERSAEACRSRLIPKDSILVPCIGTVGTKLTMSPIDCFTNQSVNTIVPNEDYDNHYIYYLIRNFLPALKGFNKGTASGREYIAKSAFENIEINVHADLAIQQKIGKLLSAYDDLIENCRRQIALLEEAAQRLYCEWFVDFRFPGHESTTCNEDGLPKSWNIVQLVSIYDIKYGKALSSKCLIDDGLYPVYGATKQIGRYNKYNCDDYRVLITSRGDAGFIHQTFYKKSFVTCNSFIVCPKKEFDYIHRCYIYYSLLALNLKGIVNGAAQQQLTNAMLDNVLIVMPSPSVLHQFSMLIEPYSELIIQKIRQIELLTEARDRLLPKLMSGEINVE